MLKQYVFGYGKVRIDRCEYSDGTRYLLINHNKKAHPIGPRTDEPILPSLRNLIFGTRLVFDNVEGLDVFIAILLWYRERLVKAASPGACVRFEARE